MDLILWRHAEAVDAEFGQPDLTRHLSERGEKQARRVARWFSERRPNNLRILVSPAHRTLQTGHALALPFEVEKRIGTDADVADLIAAAGWPEAGGSVLLIGHQPTLGRLAALLLSGQEADWAIKKGALWWFSRRDGATVLRAVMPPELLKSS
jgi:phosphohistidine phosphatase